MTRTCFGLAMALSIGTAANAQVSAPQRPTFINVGSLQVSVDEQLGNSFPAYVGEGPALMGPSANPGESLQESYTVQTDDGRISTYTGGAAAATGENVLAQLRVRVRNTASSDDKIAVGDVQVTCGSRQAELMAVGRGGQPFVKRGNWMERARSESVRLTKRTMSMLTYIFIVPRGAGDCRVTFRDQALSTFSAPQR